MQRPSSNVYLTVADSARTIHRAIALLPLALVVWSLAASAQTPAPRSYTPVAITRPAASDDKGFAAFRERLAAVAKRRVYAELVSLVESQGFFWGRDFDYRFDPHKPAVDNLAAAIALERKGGEGWERLAEFAAQPSVEPLASRPGVVCGPARPDFDATAFSKLQETTFTDGVDWAYPRADATAVRSEPDANAKTIGTLKPAFVMLLGFEGADNEPDRSFHQWAHVVQPDGSTGFVAPGTLTSLASARLCYIKDPVDGWRIAGYISGTY